MSPGADPHARHRIEQRTAPQITEERHASLHTRCCGSRDYAWLMIEALRRLGFASRFVTGYLYDAALDGGAVGMSGSGATHAWLQVFLPGAGWLDYDPTNQISAGFDLIPVAVATSRSGNSPGGLVVW